MTNIGNTNRAQIISDLTEILAILTKYEHAYQDLKTAEAQQKVNDEQAKRDNAMVKLQADKARNSMNLMQKRYMQKFAHYLPEQYANIASVKELLRIFTVDENISSLQEAINILERNPS